MEKGRDLEMNGSWELHELHVLQQRIKHIWNVKARRQLEEIRSVIVAIQTTKKNDNIRLNFN